MLVAVYVQRPQLDLWELNKVISISFKRMFTVYDVVAHDEPQTFD
jgi:hypothetical protein